MLANSWPSGVRLKDELRISAPDFRGVLFQLRHPLGDLAGEDAQAGGLQRGLLFVARDGDAQLHFVALDFRAFAPCRCRLARCARFARCNSARGPCL